MNCNKTTSKKTMYTTLRRLSDGTASKSIRIAAYALNGLPVGGWPETQQAMRLIENELPRGIDCDDFVDAVYIITSSGRYESKF